MAEKKKMMESAAPAADKKKALETAMAQIEKTYGKGAIMRLGTNTRVVVESIPTGSVALDLALGIFLTLCSFRLFQSVWSVCFFCPNSFCNTICS